MAVISSRPWTPPISRPRRHLAATPAIARPRQYHDPAEVFEKYAVYEGPQSFKEVLARPYMLTLRQQLVLPHISILWLVEFLVVILCHMLLFIECSRVAMISCMCSQMLLPKLLGQDVLVFEVCFSNSHTIESRYNESAYYDKTRHNDNFAIYRIFTKLILSIQECRHEKSLTHVISQVR